MIKRRKLTVLACSLAGVLALAGPAAADTTIRLTVGPLPIPNVPVEVCVSQSDAPEDVDECVSTPAGESISLTVVVTVDTPAVVVTPPTITPIACPAGTSGVAAQVFTGSAEVTVGGSVTVVGDDGTPVTIPIEDVVGDAGQTLTVYACVGVSPGL